MDDDAERLREARERQEERFREARERQEERIQAMRARMEQMLARARESQKQHVREMMDHREQHMRNALEQQQQRIRATMEHRGQRFRHAGDPRVQFLRGFFGQTERSGDQREEIIEEAMGRRERKKAATRQALADAAMELFLKYGYDQVSVRDIADAADVSTTTLFKYFPSKEALVFDQDEEMEAETLAIVRDRPEGTTILEALREEFTRVGEHVHDPRIATFMHLIASTPALSDYSARMWQRHAESLACVIAEEIGAPPDDPTCAALARFVLDVRIFAITRPDPQAAIASVFDLLENGWKTIGEPREKWPRQ